MQHTLKSSNELVKELEEKVLYLQAAQLELYEEFLIAQDDNTDKLITMVTNDLKAFERVLELIK